jgi:hypothetical protein
MKVIHEAEIPGINGVTYMVRSLEDGSLEIHGRGTYPSLWIAPTGAANVAVIVPVELSASMDRRPLVRDEKTAILLGRVRRALENALFGLQQRAPDVDEANRLLVGAGRDAKELDDLIRPDRTSS